MPQAPSIPAQQKTAPPHSPTASTDTKFNGLPEKSAARTPGGSTREHGNLQERQFSVPLEIHTQSAPHGK